MVGDHPHGMVLVFHNRAHAGPHQSAGHIQQIDTLRVRVVNSSSRRGALPDESATILHDTDRRGHNGGCLGSIRNNTVDKFARNRIEKTIVPTGAHH